MTHKHVVNVRFDSYKLRTGSTYRVYGSSRSSRRDLRIACSTYYILVRVVVVYSRLGGPVYIFTGTGVVVEIVPVYTPNFQPKVTIHDQTGKRSLTLSERRLVFTKYVYNPVGASERKRVEQGRR